MEVEVHVYALAVAAAVLLSFYPFLIVMLSFFRNVARWPAGVAAIYVAIEDFFPGGLADFIQRNLPATRGVHIASMVLLLFTANGIFEPLEIALNKVWGAQCNRSYWRNQLVALGLIFLCGGLALLSLVLTALQREWLAAWGGLLFKLAAVPISMLALFFMYWLLPNRKIRAREVAPVAIVVGLTLEALKYVNLLVWPLVRAKLNQEYGVFQNSATILLWSFFGAMVVLAGAEWAARRNRANPLS